MPKKKAYPPKEENGNANKKKDKKKKSSKNKNKIIKEVKQNIIKENTERKINTDEDCIIK